MLLGWIVSAYHALTSIYHQYLLDVDMVKLLPQLFDDLKNNFMLPSILPGGSHCMMNALNINGR